jgi:hypothetical protein
LTALQKQSEEGVRKEKLSKRGRGHYQGRSKKQNKNYRLPSFFPGPLSPYNPDSSLGCISLVREGKMAEPEEEAEVQGAFWVSLYLPRVGSDREGSLARAKLPYTS